MLEFSHYDDVNWLLIYVFAGLLHFVQLLVVPREEREERVPRVARTLLLPLQLPLLLNPM